MGQIYNGPDHYAVEDPVDVFGQGMPGALYSSGLSPKWRADLRGFHGFTVASRR